MDAPQLNFSISNQIITRTDTFDVVSDSKGYLYASFEFLTDEWTEYNVKTALFRRGKNRYETLVDSSNTCLVPWEVLEGADGYIFVSVYAIGEENSGQEEEEEVSVLVTANEAGVRVLPSGYSSEAGPSTPPTPSIYEQILEKLDTLEGYADRAEASAEAAEASSQTAAGSAQDASQSAQTADTYAQTAEAHAQTAATSAETASAAATAAAQSAEEAASYKPSLDGAGVIHF